MLLKCAALLASVQYGRVCRRSGGCGRRAVRGRLLLPLRVQLAQLHSQSLPSSVAPIDLLLDGLELGLALHIPVQRGIIPA